MLQARVTSANQLYHITCELAETCIQLGKYFAIENPGRSFMWDTAPFKKLCQKFSLLEVFFHHCMYGSSRRKLTKFLHNIPSFQTLEIFCDNNHQHEPWGQSPAGHWRTSEETAYPWDLCRAIASKLAIQLQSDGFMCHTPAFAVQEASLLTMRAATNLQPRRGLPPMVPEYKSIVHHPVDQPLPSHARKLSTPHQGIAASEVDPSHKQTVTIGIHYKPEEFIQRAIEIGHPTKIHSFFPTEVDEVVKQLTRCDPGTIARGRTEEIKRWVHLSKALENDETSLKSQMSYRRRAVLNGKHLSLFRRLLLDAGHADTNLVEHLCNGFDLTGGLPESGVFARRMKPAVLSCEELRRVAGICRDSLLQSVSSSGDQELDSQLYEATLKEVAKGYLIGPVDPGSLPKGATLTKRFGVKQKNKVRPIDDYKASMVNSSVAQTETATVHTIDHIAALVACFLKASDGKREGPNLVAKTWDLKDAYKQIPLSDHAYSQDSFLAVFNPKTGTAEVFQQKVLPFGSIASVTAFLRVAHGVWKLGAELLQLAWTSYFDDFFSVTHEVTARHTEFVIAAMFRLLGWNLFSEKLVDYHTVCKVLGVEFDFKLAGQGLVLVRNTEDRVKELCDEIDGILGSRVLKRTDGERLRGRLQFASGQLFGRYARNKMRQLSKHISSGRTFLSEDTVAALVALKSQFSSNLPREVSGSLSEHVHIYVDASFDPDSFCGVGGAIYNSSGNPLAFFSEEVHRSFIEEAMAPDQKTMIQELEMLALLIAAQLWLPEVKGKKVVSFTDSEAVRGSFLKSWSQNDKSSDLLMKIFELEETHSCQIWIERVPSQSNPADELSRCVLTKWSGINSTRVDLREIWSKCGHHVG